MAASLDHKTGLSRDLTYGTYDQLVQPVLVIKLMNEKSIEFGINNRSKLTKETTYVTIIMNSRQPKVLQIPLHSFDRYDGILSLGHRPQRVWSLIFVNRRQPVNWLEKNIIVF